MKLNLGCGHNHLDDYINIDNSALCEPDLCFDLEQPWPLQDSCAQEIVMFHVMEHLGQSTQVFLSVMRELYRVSADQCLWKITVPHYNSDIYHIDPTHVRKIHPVTLKMFDQAWNHQDLLAGGHHTKLGLQCAIDIEVTAENYFLSEPWNSQLQDNNLDDINFAGRHFNNVCSDIYIECKVHKPCRIQQ